MKKKYNLNINNENIELTNKDMSGIMIALDKGLRNGDIDYALKDKLVEAIKKSEKK